MVDAQASGPPSVEQVLAEGRYVLRVLRRLGVPESDREDRAQDVLIAAHQALPSFEAGRPLRPWLHGIAFNVVRRQRALAHNKREVLMDDAVAEPVDRAPDPEQAVSEAWERDLLARMMEGLDLDHRAVVSMYIDGIGMPEIALALGIAVATGWKRLNEARRTLAAALQRSPRPTGVMPVPLTLDGLFAAERNGPDGLAESVVERVRSRVRDALRAAPLLGTSGSAVGETARLAARAVRNAFVRGAIVGAVVGGATAGGATAAYLRHGGVADPPPVPVASIAAPALPAGLVASAAPPEPGPTAVTSSSTAVPAAPPSSAAPRAAVSDLNDDEASLIRTARMAYAHGETTHALDALNRHARKYPRGQLAADREALRAQVLAAAAAASSAPAPSATSPPRVRFGIDE